MITITTNVVAAHVSKGAVACVVLAAALCLGGNDPAFSASADAQDSQTQAPLNLVLELPEAFFAKNADGSHLVTAFRVGFFQGANPTPIATSDVPREAVSVEGVKGRLRVQSDHAAAARGGSVVVRVQTLTRNEASAWSDVSVVQRVFAPLPATATAKAVEPRVRQKPPDDVPGGKVRKPAEPRDQAKRADDAAAGGKASRREARKGPRVSMADVERHPRLLEAFRQTLSAEAKPEQVLSSFRTVEELSTAVALCRQHQIELDKLVETTEGPPGTSLASAAQKLKPSLRGTNALQKARAEGKQLLGPPQP